MRIGDVVRVRASGREGQIVADLGKNQRQVQFYPAGDPAVGDSPGGGEDGGIFHDHELEPIQVANDAG